MQLEVHTKAPQTLELKVDVPKSNTTTIWTPIFEWYVIWCRSKNWHQKRHHVIKEIELRAQNMLIVLGLNRQYDWAGSM